MKASIRPIEVSNKRNVFIPSPSPTHQLIKYTQTFKPNRIHVSSRIVCRRGSNGERSSQRRQGPGKPGRGPQPRPLQLAKEYAIPIIGLVGISTAIGPLFMALCLTAVGIGAAVAATATALSLSTLLLPFMIFFGGFPLLIAAGKILSVIATAAGLIALPFIASILFQTVFVAGGLWLGFKYALPMLFGAAIGEEEEDEEDEEGYGEEEEGYYYSSSATPPKRKAVVRKARDVVIDVDADVEQDIKWQEEQKRRRREMDEFDRLLRKREAEERERN